MTITGIDDFGDFVLRGGRCARCHSKGIVVKYNRNAFELPNGIRLESTIIGRHYNKTPSVYPVQLGITCGHYASFHRQVAHIVDSMNGINRANEHYPAGV